MPKTIGELRHEACIEANLRRIADALDAIAGVLAEMWRQAQEAQDALDEGGTPCQE